APTTSSIRDSNTPSKVTGSSVHAVVVANRTKPIRSSVAKSNRTVPFSPALMRPVTSSTTGPVGSGIASPGISVGSRTTSSTIGSASASPAWPSRARTLSAAPADALRSAGRRGSSIVVPLLGFIPRQTNHRLENAAEAVDSTLRLYVSNPNHDGGADQRHLHDRFRLALEECLDRPGRSGALGMP